MEALIQMIAKLPGLGPRSARRIVLHLLKNKEKTMMPLAEMLARTATSIHRCTQCGNLDTSNPCSICTDSSRDRSIICIVEDVADLWAFERSKIFRGQYHVLGGILSALDGIGPEDLHIPKLLGRAQEETVQEIILAMNATVEGQTTAHYLTQQLKTLPLKITRLAHGLPIGGELDYLDDGTLSTALQARISC